MNELERFECVVGMEEPDYWPLLAAHALGSPHKGGLIKMHAEGLPDYVSNNEEWFRYWGECTFDTADSIGIDTPGIPAEKSIEDGYEVVRYQTGAKTRQVINNDVTYSMPDFQLPHVRDRKSWERYRELTSPQGKDWQRLDSLKDKYKDRTRPLAVACGGTWGQVRMDMGPELALLALYDTPDLVHDMIDHMLQIQEEFVFPVIETLRPEIVTMWEDFAYNHGLLISPKAFREYCAPYYRRVAEVAKNCGVKLLFVDCDGKVDEYIELLDEVGFNGLMPLEQVCGNDITEYRRKLPGFIFLGGIEKELASAGNSSRMDAELEPAARKLLDARGTFPMFDHALSTNVGFEEHCRCMTRLHELCGSAELGLGEFPRRR